jgi:hypothetical protein
MGDSVDTRSVVPCAVKGAIMTVITRIPEVSVPAPSIEFGTYRDCSGWWQAYHSGIHAVLAADAARADRFALASFTPEG